MEKLAFFTRIGIWIAIIGLAGCSNDVFTEPATITCQFVSSSTTAMTGKLVFERVDLNIDKLDISGRRTSENDMFFTRRFDRQNGYFPLLDNTMPTTILQIPQGSYETLVFYTTLREEDYEFEYGNNAGEDDETGDLQEYVAQAKPGLLLVARYTNGATTFPVIVSLNDDIRRFAVEATQGGTSAVVLQRDVPALATYTLDPAFLFTSITEAALENAIKFSLGSELAVVVSEEYNEALYNQLAGRIQGAVTLTVENQ